MYHQCKRSVIKVVWVSLEYLMNRELLNSGMGRDGMVLNTKSTRRDLAHKPIKVNLVIYCQQKILK